MLRLPSFPTGPTLRAVLHGESPRKAGSPARCALDTVHWTLTKIFCVATLRAVHCSCLPEAATIRARDAWTRNRCTYGATTCQSRWKSSRLYKHAIPTWDQEADRRCRSASKHDAIGVCAVFAACRPGREGWSRGGRYGQLTQPRTCNEGRSWQTNPRSNSDP